MKSKTVMVLMLAVMAIGLYGFPGPMCSTTHAQSPPSQDVTWFQWGPFAVGQDNGIYAGIGERGFAASGVGVDVASMLDGYVFLHGSLLTKWNDSPGKKIMPAATANVDMIKLVTKTGKVTILIPNLSLFVGPSVVYQPDSGKWNPGGMFNLRYAF